MSTTMQADGHALRKLAQRDERVFPSYPQVSRYFPAGSIEDARGRLARAIERGDGPGLVIGGPGTGKSLLLQALAAQYHEQFDVVLPACARLCTRRALLQSILFELGLPYRSRDEGELRISLLDHLLSKEDCPTGLLLLVDEAQTLSIALLDELRVLTNLVHGALPRVRLVLAGSSSLEECFAHPELESFSQRLTARCYLGPFNREETTQFIRAQLAASGATPDNVFAADAWPAVFEATDGVPRLVNQLCDRALVDAIAAGYSQIDRQVIQAAWADIQQLPTPWDTPGQTTETPTARAIEFGNLECDHRCEPVVFDVPQDDESQHNSIAGTKLTEFDTELDIDDEPAASHPLVESSVTPLPQSSGAKWSSDPFAEKFDEEEVVLDNFAAWDDMFRRDMPRVANRRDREFATLIEAAIAVAPKSEDHDENRTVDAAFEFGVLNHIDGCDDLAAETEPVMLQSDEGWPPLRIAETSDVTTTSPFPLPLIDDDPVLIIEEEAAVLASPKSPVRRGEYRHLFSRLRSG